MHEMTGRERAELLWLAQQTDLAWGGIYDRGGRDFDIDIRRWEDAGLIEAVARRHSAGRMRYSSGRLTFGGGYRITDAGRRLVMRRNQ